MKYLLFGAAGHIDHGKTALVRALTGIDTDRLAEEKRRGITIDLGFAHLPFPGGVAGIVDVPGHEKFLRNMLAGASALDLVLMVVAADEGVMPQTREHLEILELLGARRGVVVLTKTDLADEETLAFAHEEARSAFAGSFLENAPFAAVSCVTGAGIGELRELLCGVARELPPHDASGPFRMWVDRSFTVDGFGAVATGPVTGGAVSVGDEVELLASGARARVRGLQSYGAAVERVAAGQRAALNLARVETKELGRGVLLAAPGFLRAGDLLDVKLRLLPRFGRVLKSGARLHLHLGTASLCCRAALLGRDELWPGEGCYAQLRLETPVAARAGDRFVVRFYSPVETAGGGVVLDAAPRRHKRLDTEAAERLKWYDTGGLEDQILYEAGHADLDLEGLRARVQRDGPGEPEKAARALLRQGKLRRAGELLMTPERFAARARALLQTLEGYHAAHPLEDGMPLPQLARAFPMGLVRALEEDGRMVKTPLWAAAAGFSPRGTDAFRSIAGPLRALYAGAGLRPPDLASVPAAIGRGEKETGRVAELLVESGELKRLTPALLVGREAWEAAREAAGRLIREEGSVTLAALRDELGLSRKYAAALLERMDVDGFTVKHGDARTLA